MLPTPTPDFPAYTCNDAPEDIRKLEGECTTSWATAMESAHLELLSEIADFHA